MDDRRVRSPGAAFLIAQLGGHSARRWIERLAKAGLEPREVMLFRHVAVNQGRSQREVADAIGLPQSRIVALVDGLEAKGWIRRQPSASDRRTNALHLTRKGQAALTKIMAVSAEHEADLTRGLEAGELDQLIKLLGKVAGVQDLIEGVHPGFGDANADQTQQTGDR
ncbi:MAG TPA: MarR family winged helix-turn-helix transcriptional regulator [Candidatus Limnocylindrales bacterium]|nr:MarR family winged helix-turn-helix transcriptional regulator [Candidatus Limnocylindrales bacterium]